MSAPAKLPPIDELVFQHIVQSRPPHVSGSTEPHAYASEALGCDRKLAFRILAVPKSNPIEGGSHFTFWLGDAIHDLVQSVVLSKYPEAQKEVRWRLERVSGRADATYRTPAGLVVAEFKSVAPYSFDLAVGLKKGQEGPRAEHVMQANLSAHALEADFLHIVYVNKSASGKSNPIAEWRIKADHSAAVAEVERLSDLVELAIDGTMPPRYFAGELIKEPGKTNFPCSYCEWQQTCDGLAPGPLTQIDGVWQPIDAVEAPF